MELRDIKGQAMTEIQEYVYLVTSKEYKNDIRTARRVKDKFETIVCLGLLEYLKQQEMQSFITGINDPEYQQYLDGNKSNRQETPAWVQKVIDEVYTQHSDIENSFANKAREAIIKHMPKRLP